MAYTKNQAVNQMSLRDVLATHHFEKLSIIIIVKTENVNQHSRYYT